MATIANYPDGIGTAGPTIDRLLDDPIDYQTDTFRCDDGSVRVNVQPCGREVIVLEYDGLSQAELSIIRDHYNLAKGQVNDFSFYNRRKAQTYAGFRYLSLAIGQHTKNWFVPLRVTLIRFA